MVYSTLTRGFKSGGTNSLSGDPAFDPEYLWSLELGGKSTLADGRATANAAALFYYDYTDLQVSTFTEGTVSGNQRGRSDRVGTGDWTCPWCCPTSSPGPVPLMAA